MTLIDKCNHHLFQPLLYQVATAELSPADIAQPIRSILRKAKNTDVVLAEVTAIDKEARRVVTPDRAYSYDFLIVAGGARHAYFGHPEWEQFAPGLKSIEDALEIRRRVLTAFEVAERTTDESERRAALNFVIIGAGPTGVEMAGAIAEIARHALAKDFRHVNPAEARVILLDAAPKVMSMFPGDLPEKALRQLQHLGIEVRCNTSVRNLTAEGVHLDDETIRAQTVIWAAGNQASPLARCLGCDVDRAGRVIVNDNLTIPGHQEIHVIGDMANFSHAKKPGPLPGVAPVAPAAGQTRGAEHPANARNENAAGVSLLRPWHDGYDWPSRRSCRCAHRPL